MNAIQVFPIGKIENADGNTRIVLQNEYAAGLKESWRAIAMRWCSGGWTAAITRGILAKILRGKRRF